ncbi:MAG TPA: arylesterase [Thermoanaerobaculia bacterium]|jgi:acyl-CoA thioesterase-1|nr:arylesterase [Thermoanaerobaculia bacterium]
MASTQKIPTLLLAVLIPMLPMVWACGGQVSEDQPRATQAALRTPAPAARPAAAPAPAPVAKTPLVVFLGDSLTAGLGLDEDQAYPAVLERELGEEGLPVRVLNAGVSGDTTAGGLSRIGWILGQRPDVVVVALGANDGLRALPVEQAEKNLREIVRRSQAAGARVLLLGMKMPPNYGPDYTSRFEGMYTAIAKDMNVPLLPFLLEGVGGDRRLNQADGIHPTAEGQEILAENVKPYLEDVLREPKPKGAVGAGAN